MPVHPNIHLAQIERKLRNLEQLLMELVKQQRQQEQLTVLTEMLGTLKQQNLKQHQEEEWLDSFEIMRVFHISRSTLYRWKRNQFLSPRRLGNRDIYLKREVERLFKKY